MTEGSTIEVGTPIIIIDVAPGAQPPLEVVGSARTANLVGYGPARRLARTAPTTRRPRRRSLATVAHLAVGRAPP